MSGPERCDGCGDLIEPDEDAVILHTRCYRPSMAALPPEPADRPLVEPWQEALG